MGTARYYPQGFRPAAIEPVHIGRVASIIAGVAVVSAFTVFLSLCARDNSQLLALSRSETRAAVSSQQAQVIPAEQRVSNDNITRVTVPEVSASEASAAKPAIARSRTEPLSLEKLPNGRYVEFKLARSRRFQQVGPLSIGVWRIDNKHKLYDVSLLGQGHRVDRKHVGLNSPVSIATSVSERPLQLVVTAIDRNGVSGYLSEPQSGR